MEQFGPNPGQARIKLEPNSNFSAMVNNERRRAMLIGNNAYFEINNCLFLGDDSTRLFTIANADYAYVYIREGHFTLNDCVWSLRLIKKTIFGHRKMSKRRMPNQLQFGEHGISDIEQLIINTNWNFYQLYTYERSLPGSRLPEYTLPDAGQVPCADPNLPTNNQPRRLN